MSADGMDYLGRLARVGDYAQWRGGGVEEIGIIKGRCLGFGTACRQRLRCECDSEDEKDVEVQLQLLQLDYQSQCSLLCGIQLAKTTVSSICTGMQSHVLG